MKIIGKAGSATAYKIRDYLERSDVPFEWIELTNDQQARAEAGVNNLQDPRLPVCIFSDGTSLECPTIRQITEKLGWFRNPTLAEYDLAIYGAGPAGLSAAVYGASEGLKTVVIERSAVGGQAGTTSRIENYLGFPKGIAGADLAERAREQALPFWSGVPVAARRSRWRISSRQDGGPSCRWHKDHSAGLLSALQEFDTDAFICQRKRITLALACITAPASVRPRFAKIMT